MEVPNAAVVPLDPDQWTADVADLDPWQLLASGRGLLVRWDATPAPDGLAPFGPALAGSSELARHITTVMQRAGTQVANLPPNLVSVELPAGSAMTDLVSAVGGGFRGTVRVAGSPGFTGQARLVPVSGAAVAGGAAVATPALAPVLAVMAISIGMEMVARHQLEKKLATITGVAARLDQHNVDRGVAELKSAEQAITLGSAALLDQVSIPSSIGLGSACDRVRVVMQHGVESLARWEETANAQPSRDGTISYPRLLSALGVEDNPRRFPDTVASLYHATVLDSRAKVLLAAEAALANPDRPLENLHRQLRVSLTANADVLDRLREVLWALAEPRLRAGRTAPTPAARAAVAAFDRTLTGLAIAASRTPAAPAMVNAAGRQVLELARASDGQLQPQTSVDPQLAS